MIGRGSSFYFAAAALTLSHQPARAADEPVRLAPSSKWHLEYADDSCRLARQFEEGDRTSYVVIERFEPGDHFRLTVTGSAFGRARSGADATLQFGPAESEQSISFMEGKWVDRPALIFSGSLRIAPMTEQEKLAREALQEADEARLFEPAPIGAERERAATFLSVEAPGMSAILFETGSLAEPFAALRKCTDELLTHWGVDVQHHKSLTRRAIPTKTPQRWLDPSDYPSTLLRKGTQGIVNFRLSVDSEGKVSDCHIQRSTPPGGFDEKVCAALTRRARFEPALDAEGNPMASYFISTVIFAIP